MLWSCCQIITSASRGKVWSEASVIQFSWIIVDHSCPRVWEIMCFHYLCCKCVIFRYVGKFVGICVCIFSICIIFGSNLFGEMWDPQQSLFSRSLRQHEGSVLCHTPSQIQQHRWSKHLACCLLAPSDWHSDHLTDICCSRTCPGVSGAHVNYEHILKSFFMTQLG